MRVIRGMLVIPLLSAALAGCATTAPPESTGTRMAAVAGRASDLAHMQGELADQWKHGQTMANDGEKQMAGARGKADRATRDLAKYGKRAEQAKSDQEQATSSLNDGQVKVTEGQRLMTDAEQRFTTVPPVGL